MPAVVTFDPVRLLIIEIPVFAGSPEVMQDNDTSFQEIYSEWKEWSARYVSPSGGLGPPPAIRQVGGDPITDTQDLGITYFMTFGWRMKPAEGNHRWVVDGNVWTDPPGQSVFALTDGAFQVNTELKVSNLVDAAIARLDLLQLINTVYIDTIRGVSGTGTIGTTQIGTPTLPSNNIADARIIADTFNVRTYKLNGSIVLDQSHTDWNIEGIASKESTIVDFNGQDITGSLFVTASLKGSASGGTFDASDCELAEVLNLLGHFSNCGFEGNFSLAPGGSTTFDHCYSEIPGSSTPVCDWNGAQSANWRAYSGGLEIQNMGASSPMTSPNPTASVDLSPGTLLMGSTNVGGFVKVRGVGEFIDTLGSPSTTVDQSELVRGSDLQTTRKIAQNRTLTDPVTGIMTVFDDNDVDVFLQADLFEGVTTAQPYRGQGAERRDRLI